MTAPRSRVFLVEDEDLVSMLVEDMLDYLGYEVSASAATLAAGMKAAAAGGFDVALLDVNLRGVLSFPIADMLVERGIPFLFVSGYSASGIEPRFSKVPTLQKPYALESLEQVLSHILATRPKGQT